MENKKLKCEKCSEEIRDNFNYCPYCGLKLKKTDYHERLRRIKEKYPNAYEPWSVRDEKKLAFLYRKGRRINEIAIALKRQPGGIKSRLRKIGLIE